MVFYFHSILFIFIEYYLFIFRYRGAAHRDCYIQYQDSRTIPVVFHNLSGYDAHFIIKEISNCIEGRVDLLAINKEKYISFTKNIEGSRIKFRFIDSYRFLPESLEKLATYTTKFTIIDKFAQKACLSKIQIDLLKRKGVFPYDYMTSLGKLDETQLPPKEAFYSSLYNTDISTEEYQHAQNV